MLSWEGEQIMGNTAIIAKLNVRISYWHTVSKFRCLNLFLRFHSPFLSRRFSTRLPLPTLSLRRLPSPRSLSS
jgi:hypothetical protein